jgi:glyoxylase-like metal-dependent hydrolase (beta-lactamase superfamily II)
LHFDHIGNNENFPKAKFLVPSEEMNWALTPPHHGGSGPYFIQFAKHVRVIQDQITTIGYEGEIIPGVKFFRIGAHSPGFTAVGVKTDIGRVVLAGDVMLDAMNIKYNWPAGFYYRLDEFTTAFKRIHDEADIILPGHDWIVWHDYQNGIIG